MQSVEKSAEFVSRGGISKTLLGKRKRTADLLRYELVRAGWFRRLIIGRVRDKGMLDICLISFWAADSNETMSCRTRGNFRPSVRPEATPGVLREPQGSIQGFQRAYEGLREP